MNLPPNQVLAHGWPRLDIDPPVEPVGLDIWRLRVWGEVERPLDLSFAELRALGEVESEADFHCVTGWSMLGSKWRGVPLAAIMAAAGPRESAQAVLCHGLRAYSTNLLLDDLCQPECLLVWERNGGPVSHEHGGPVRFLVPHLYAWKAAKWATGIEVLTEERLGFWETRGYHRRGDPWREERFS